MAAKKPKSSASVTKHATAQRFDAKAAKLSKQVARSSARSPTRDVKPKVHVSAKPHRTKASGNSLADRIKSELQVLVGQPLRDLGRAANMQIVGFGRQRRMRNRRGKIVYACDVRLHVQSRWRLVDGDSILFGRDDLNYLADETISSELFDSDKGESILDSAQREWLKQMRPRPPVVRQVRGDPYGGFRLLLTGGLMLECFPCDSRRGEYSEQWRLLGHRPDGAHFVVTGDGVEVAEGAPGGDR